MLASDQQEEPSHDRAVPEPLRARAGAAPSVRLYRMTVTVQGARAVTAGALYDAALLARMAGADATLRATGSARHLPLPLGRWCAPPDRSEVAVLEWLHAQLPDEASVLDLGCGPGRHSAYLAQQGLRVLGVDTSAVALELARARGVDALRADALGRLPACPAGGQEGAGWDGVLLLDGNIGLGGDPHLLLCRVRDLLAPAGHLLVELDTDGVTDRRSLHLDDGVTVSEAFAWARLGADSLARHACLAGLRVVAERTVSGRVFALLTPDGC